MQLSGTIISALLLAATNLPSASALVALDRSPLNITGSTYNLVARNDFGGTCQKDGQCRGGWPTFSYDCVNSECRPEDLGKRCHMASDVNNDYVAKCPTNLLSYEWDWPWLDCTKKGNRKSGTCKNPDCKSKWQKTNYNCVNPPKNKK